MKIQNRENLIEYVNHGNTAKYIFFWGHTKSKQGVSKSCFSQWYDSPFNSEGHHFMTAEHYMMYHKAVLFGDEKSAKKLLVANNPGAAKAIGREVIGFDQKIWESQRMNIVIAANTAKFNSDPELKSFLINTGNRILVEASPVDPIWGIGLAEDDPACENPNLWKGTNLLGFALMAVRDQFSQL